MNRCVFVLALAAATSVHAAPEKAARAAGDIPDALQAWIPWVLHGAERDRCPPRTDGVRVCEAPGRLELVVEPKGGTFTQLWHTDVAGLVSLPGDAHHWPLDVEVDGKPAVVIDVGGGPHAELAVGEHTLRGRFFWDAPPESLPIPAATAAVRLVVAGKDVPFVDRGDAGDRVWLKRERAAEEREDDRLDVAVFRKIADGVPLLVETRILLEVSGKGREVVLPGALLAGFSPLALTGSLPAHVEGNALKVQVRPGRHTLTLTARRATDDRTLTAPPAPEKKADDDASTGEEVWVFQADHAVRVANVTGVPSIVAEQTRLPDEWRALPAYRVLPGEKVTLDQQRRGDESPPPSQLTLMRTLWLDFDGVGFTVHDELGGRFTGDRLAMGAGTTLGRVATGDSAGDAFITRLPGAGGDGAVGVEVRSPMLRVTADSRIDARAGSFPAVSWAHDFQSVTELLHLPPGFRVWHASGVDEVQTTWIKSWTLFELFLVVVITLAMARLWGPLVGGVALVGLVLTFQEDGAVRGLWISVVALAALHRVLPPAWESRGIASVIRVTRVGLAIVVSMVALAFSIGQIRVGMYPVLEQEDRKVGDGQLWGRIPYGAGNDTGTGMLALGDKSAPATTVPEPMNARAQVEDIAKDEVQQMAKGDDVDGRFGRGGGGGGESLSSSNGNLGNSYAGKIAQKKQRLQQIDPNAVVQTGPGLPQWGFTTVQLRFTGPVKADQQIHLVVTGPATNLMLAFLRVLLTAFLVVVSFGLPGKRWPAALARAFRGKGALFAVVVIALAASTVHAAEPADAPSPPNGPAAPGDKLLTDLKARLLEAPACAPSCASLARVALDADSATLRLRAEVHALADTAVPLPGADKQWSASTILVDGKPTAAALRDGTTLWVAVARGRHDVVIEGPLPGRDSVQLTFPLVPHRATFQSTAWTLDGVHEDGVPDANLQLTRTSRAHDGAPASDAEAPVLPPFLSVERSLLLGLSFEVETRVSRLSPAGSAVVLEVPLLPGENVTTEGVRVEGKKALISLGPNDTEFTWSGVLAPTPNVELTAPADAAFVEVWSLQASPVWHVEESGIPPLHEERPGSSLTWRPWPGEKLALAVTRPEGVAGQTITVERTSQQVRPGLRSTDVTLTLDMRASRGGEHVVTLPAGAELLSASVNGAPQPLRPAGDKVTVPIVPGTQQVVLTARVPAGITTAFHTPRFDIGNASVNAEVLIEVPSDRWVLFAVGPRAGPAVLFWSFIVVLILSGVALSRVPFSPLKLHHWVLLGLGLTQVPIAVAALVAGWLLVLGWRRTSGEMSPSLFNLRQIVIACWTVAALIGLVASIREGLLGAPDMQIAGNGSTAGELRWFADHGEALLPSSTMLSLPMSAYRVAMLAWALWLAYALLRWLRFGWSAFGVGGLWRTVPKAPPRPRPGTGASAMKIPEQPGAPTSAAVPSTSTVPPAAPKGEDPRKP